MQPRLLRSPVRLAGTSLLRLQSDERLVALARDGHEPAFAAIVERYRAPLERYAGRIAGAERAEDAVQQALAGAHRALVAHPERDVELRPWLYRIVHNTSLNQLRGARDEAPLDAAEPAAADDAFERRERLREALDAVAALPRVQRDAILLRELEGRSHAEIAAALGVSAGAARQHLFRARGALRAAITAITPQPFLERLLFAATGSGAPETAAAGGVGLLLAKASAGVLATGALAGGAVGTGVVHTPRHHESARPAAARAAGLARPRAAVTTPIAAAPARRATVAVTTVPSNHRRATATGGAHLQRAQRTDDRGDSGASGDDGTRRGSTPGSGSADDSGSVDHGTQHGASGDDGGNSGSDKSDDTTRTVTTESDDTVTTPDDSGDDHGTGPAETTTVPTPATDDRSSPDD